MIPGKTVGTIIPAVTVSKWFILLDNRAGENREDRLTRNELIIGRLSQIEPIPREAIDWKQIIPDTK